MTKLSRCLNNCEHKYHSKGLCVKCYNKDYAKRHAGLANDRAKSWYAANKQSKIAYDLEYNKKNRGKKNVQAAAWANMNKEKRSNSTKAYYRNNRKQLFAYGANRRARVLQAMPKWLTEEHKKQISDMYKNRPDGYHVDHIVPLQGKEVCGLHVPWNLQYLLAIENFKKGNRYG